MTEKEPKAHTPAMPESSEDHRKQEERTFLPAHESPGSRQERRETAELEEMEEIRTSLHVPENLFASPRVDASGLSPEQRRVLEQVIDPARVSEEEPPWGEVGDFYETHKGALGGKLKEVWAMLWDSEARRRRDLSKISAEYGFQKVYYPGSGADTVPRDALGADKVVHLSKERRYFDGKQERDERSGIHGGDMNVLGDFRSSPFKDGAFDAVLVKGIPVHYAFHAVGDFDRVLAAGGYVVLVRGDVLAGEVLADEIAKHFKPVKSFHGIEIYRKA